MGVKRRVALLYGRTLQVSFWNIETNYRKFFLSCTGLFLTWIISSSLLSKVYEINFHHQLLARVFSTKRKRYEKVFQIARIVLATERSITSFTFIFLGLCLSFKLTFAIKNFMNDFWNDFGGLAHDGCSC